jgi:hypothetical protein
MVRKFRLLRLGFEPATFEMLSGNFSSDYEYEYDIRQAKRMLYAS